MEMEFKKNEIKDENKDENLVVVKPLYKKLEIQIDNTLNLDEFYKNTKFSYKFFNGLNFDEIFKDVIYSHETEYIIASTIGGNIVILNLNTIQVEKLFKIGDNDDLNCIACSSDNKHLVVATDKNIFFVDVQTLKTEFLNIEQVKDIQYSYNGKYIAWCSNTAGFYIYHIASSSIIYKNDKIHAFNLKYSWNNKYIILGGGCFYFFDLEKMEFVSKINTKSNSILEWSLDNSKIITSLGKTITIWNLNTNQGKKIKIPNIKIIRKCIFLTDEKIIICADNKLLVYNLEKEIIYEIKKIRCDLITAIFVSQNKNLFFYCPCWGHAGNWIEFMDLKIIRNI